VAITEADRAWNTRVPTAQLNRFLGDALERHPPPAVHGRRVRIRYMTETKARPPTFALFGNQLSGLPQSYLRYLQNGLREAFALKGVPIRFLLRTSKNPYADE
jgi:GTP-binding protein